MLPVVLGLANAGILVTQILSIPGLMAPELAKVCLHVANVNAFAIGEDSFFC